MSVHYSKRLQRLPNYVAGLDVASARKRYETADVIKLASNESPWGPHPAVVEAVATAAAKTNRYPDQQATELRGRLAERYDLDPAGIAVSNGSCELLLAAALALLEEGAEVLYPWPSFSMYRQLAGLAGARQIEVPLDGYDTDLDAIATEITAATQLLLLCNPNNPTGTYIPAERIGAFLEQVPDHVLVILDEAYVELQTVEDPFASVDLLRRFPNLVLLRTFSKVYGLAGMRCGYGLGPAGFRAAVDAVRQPFSVNLLAATAAAEAILHQDDVERRIERTVAERIGVEERLHELGLRTAETQTNFSWIDLGGRDDGEVVEALGRAGVIVRGGTPLGGPGHIRVSFGTEEENARFLEAFEAVLNELPAPESA